MNLDKSGKLIKEARKKKGLTQEDIASRLNITSKSVSKWERGVNFPDSSLLPELGQMLGLTSDELIEGKRKEKHKNIRRIFFHIFILVFILISVITNVVLGYSCYRNYGKSRMYRIYSDDAGIALEGYLSINYDYNVLTLTNISYQGILLNSSKENKLHLSQMKLESTNMDYYKLIDQEIDDSLLNNGILILNEEYDLDNTYLHLYINEEEIIVKLLFKEIKSNNKLFN